MTGTGLFVLHASSRHSLTGSQWLRQRRLQRGAPTGCEAPRAIRHGSHADDHLSAAGLHPKSSYGVKVRV